MELDKQTEMLKLFGEFRTEQGLDFETKRNHDMLDVFEAMIIETYPDTTMVVSGHHLMYIRKGHKIPYEIASADTLIFDDAISRAVWKDKQKEVLTQLAVEPTSTRDALLRHLFSSRGQ